MVVQVEAADLLSEFIATRSPELREKLVLQSVPLVYYSLARMNISPVMNRDYEDLAHQGLIGLMEAVDRFNPDVKTLFSTYAVFCIRGRILDYMRASDWMPRKMRKQSRMLQNAISNLWIEKMREPTEEEIAAYLNTTVESVQDSLADSSRILVSLDTMIDNESEGLHEYFRDETQQNPSEMIEQNGLIENLASAIQNLSKREQLMLSLYYNDGLTFREIGKVLNVTESRVSQMHTSAIFNLKAMMRDE